MLSLEIDSVMLSGGVVGVVFVYSVVVFICSFLLIFVGVSSWPASILMSLPPVLVSIASSVVV